MRKIVLDESFVPEVVKVYDLLHIVLTTYLMAANVPDHIKMSVILHALLLEFQCVLEQQSIATVENIQNQFNEICHDIIKDFGNTNQKTFDNNMH